MTGNLSTILFNNSSKWFSTKVAFLLWQRVSGFRKPAGPVISYGARNCITIITSPSLCALRWGRLNSIYPAYSTPSSCCLLAKGGGDVLLWNAGVFRSAHCQSQESLLSVYNVKFLIMQISPASCHYLCLKSTHSLHCFRAVKKLQCMSLCSSSLIIWR